MRSIEQESLGRIVRRGVPVHGGAQGTVADALAAFIGGRLPALHEVRATPGFPGGAPLTPPGSSRRRA